MNRSIIKQRAKEALRFRYWPIVGMELIAGVLMTFCILAIFYVGPYVALSEAGFYHERHAEADGQIE